MVPVVAQEARAQAEAGAKAKHAAELRLQYEEEARKNQAPDAYMGEAVTKYGRPNTMPATPSNW